MNKFVVDEITGGVALIFALIVFAFIAGFYLGHETGEAKALAQIYLETEK